MTKAITACELGCSVLACCYVAVMALEFSGWMMMVGNALL